MHDVQSRNLPGFDLGRWPEYNSQAVHQIDRLVEGYACGRDLATQVADPTLSTIFPELEQEQQGENYVVFSTYVDRA